jgi:glycosyltransferase involved in cell wall biosynthesis
MMEGPRVSVIMNCLNGERYLREAVESVFAQTYTDWEIVFWDNASTDASAEIAKGYRDRVRYFRSEETCSLGKARNLAIAQARGEYVALLDCDDVWLPDKLDKQVPLGDADPLVALIYSDSFFIDQDGAVIGRSFKQAPPPPGDAFIGLLARRNFMPCLTVVMRRTVVEKVGGFNPALGYAEDLDLFLRILRGHKAAFVKEPLAQYRLHSGAITSAGLPSSTMETIRVTRETAKKIPSLSFRDRWAVRKRLIILWCKLAVQRLRLWRGGCFGRPTVPHRIS